MKRKISKILLLTLLVIVFGMGFSNEVSAVDLDNVAYVMVEDYELTDEKIVPGEDFTLTITLKNHSTSVEAKDVLINISNPIGIAPVYGTVSQTWVDKLKPGESTVISFDYTSSIDITEDYLDFNIAMVGNTTNSVLLRAPIGSDSPFSIMAVNIPQRVNMDEISSASVSFRVLGDKNVRNVSLDLTVDDEPISKSVIGILTAGTTRTQSISFDGLSEGQYRIKLILNYDDETDQSKSIVVADTEVEIVNKSEINENTNSSGANSEIIVKQQDNDRIILLGAGSVLILSVFIIVVILVRKRK